jgi:hypothetical protein
MDRPNKPCFVRVVANRLKVKIDSVRLQENRRAPYGKLPDATVPQPTPDNDALGVSPGFQTKESPDDCRKLLREFLYGTVHHPRRLGFSLQQHLVELLLANAVTGLVPNGIVTALAEALAPILKNRPECAIACSIAEETLFIPKLNVVAVDNNRGQLQGRMAKGQSGRCGTWHSKKPELNLSSNVKRPPQFQPRAGTPAEDRL